MAWARRQTSGRRGSGQADWQAGGRANVRAGNARQRGAQRAYRKHRVAHDAAPQPALSRLLLRRKRQWWQHLAAARAVATVHVPRVSLTHKLDLRVHEEELLHNAGRLEEGPRR